MKKELEEITNMQDFKMFLDYPRENEDKTKIGIHKKKWDLELVKSIQKV